MKNEISPMPIVPALTSRRTVLKGAAWAAPVVAVSIVTPLAAASTTLDTDLEVRFSSAIGGSTQDISFAVIDFIIQQVRNLGPQEPVMPQLVYPYPEPVLPPNPTWQDRLQLPIRYAQWLADTAAANPGYAAAVAQYGEDLIQYNLWNTAVDLFKSQLQDLAVQSNGLFFAQVSYPTALSLINHGPNTLPAGTVVNVTLTTNNFVAAHLPSTGTTTVLDTGGTSTITYVVPPGGMPAGTTLFEQPLVYNPAAITLNVGDGSGAPVSIDYSDITAVITTPNLNVINDVAVIPLGIRIDLLTGNIDAIIDQWESAIAAAELIWNVISPSLPAINWQDIISGVLPLPAP